MIGCINTNSIQFLNLKSKSGLDPEDLESQCRYYIFRYGRYPHLDELRGVDSSASLSKAIGLRKDGNASIDNILDYTNSETIEEAVPKINNEFTDLEVEITPIVENAIVEVSHRPSEISAVKELVQPDDEVNSPLVIESALNKILDLYGIKINRISNLEINSDKWKSIIPDASLVKGFVFNGEIYLTELATVDTPLHELMHLLIGNLRFANPDLYFTLVNSVEQWSNRESLALRFEGRSRNDVNEEIFVEQASMFVLGMNSNLSNLDSEILYEIRYNVKRLLDSVLMGQASVKAIPDLILFSSSLKETAAMVGSTTMNNTFAGTFNDVNSSLHRKLNNIKSDLIRKHELREDCN